MSETLANHRRIVERLSSHNYSRFDFLSWSCDRHECPSYSRSFVHRTQILTHLQHVLMSPRSPGFIRDIYSAGTDSKSSAETMKVYQHPAQNFRLPAVAWSK